MKPGRKRKQKISLPGMGGRQTMIVKGRNPYDNSLEEQTRVRNGSVFYAIHARGRLLAKGEHEGMAESRRLAGDAFLEVYERSGGRGAGAIDYAAVKVDTWPSHGGASDAQMAAYAEMRGVHDHLGRHMYRMAHAIICENMGFIAFCKAEYGHTGHSTRINAYAKLRDCCDKLDDYFGISATGKKHGRIRTTRVS